MAIQDDATLDATAHKGAWPTIAPEAELEPIHTRADTGRKNWPGVTHWFDSRIANGILEATNSLLQPAKAKTRGTASTGRLPEWPT